MRIPNINPFTKHPNATDTPEGYWVHFHRAYGNGWILVRAGLASMVHAVFPWWFQFYTAETLVKMYWANLHNSRRHKDLIDKYRKPPQCEPAEVESHPTHNWAPGNKGPRDE
jgi:hypothetical protein